MAECPHQWRLDVNDRYQKGVGVVTSLSAASLVLPILFLKDIVAFDKTHTIADALSCWVYVGWCLLSLSVLSGIVYYFCSAKWVKLAWGKDADIFGVTVTDDFIEALLDGSYFFMMTGFLAGLGCMVVFMVNFTTGG